MVVMYTKVYILPIVVFIWFPITFLVTYLIALQAKDIVAFMPYVSDTGTYSPESCVFGQMLNTGSILIGVVIYIRYRQLQEQSNYFHFVSSVKTLNRHCLWLGISATFGVSLVGNFQETNIFTVHMLGAAMAFGLGTVYQILQTLISIRIYPKVGSKNVNYYRIAISGCCFISCIITLIFAGISLLAFDGEDITKWTSNYAGYKEHVVSAIAEWITITLTMGFICTFTHEFRNLIIYEPEIEHTYEESIHQSDINNTSSIDRY
ncbi:Frag1/DRAM/Sfk1 family [Popillia japonica]|uniref:Frag1/DRAM/Sfk1 family n=1 Tax=Popillia japonica TaxID=7064 RepID=A0AAW1KHJ7_POPJA